MNMQQTCDPDRLDAFVRGELSEQQESELTAHLDQCAACGEELERRVAAADQWREAGELLTHRARRSNVADLANDPSTNGSLATTTTFAEQMDQVVGMLAPTDDPEMLGRIGGYEVSGVIGCGGMGVVFKAHDRSLDRVVAIKVMAPHLAGSGAARKRFARESKAAAAVLHPNVIAIHCVADDPKLPYLVMPYIGGASLQKRIEAEGQLGTQDTLRIGQQIAAGLAAAHAQGLVHRDIKPANILLERGVERVTITDFGLARAVDDATMTRSGVIAGTPQYMSPEQARGESIDHRSDLFSLGSVLYMMCAGHSPFRAETTFGILRRITDNQPRPLREINPDVPEWLCAIIEKLHAKEPSERFQSAEEVAELLEGCLAHVQQPSAIPLPAGVQALAAQLQSSSTESLQANRLKAKHQRVPPIGKFIAAAAGAAALFFAGVLVVLELQKGTLTIESDADDVPIRIMQGDSVVEKMTISKSPQNLRIAAGSYVVEVDGDFQGVTIKDGNVSLTRLGVATVEISKNATLILVSKFEPGNLDGLRFGERHERLPGMDIRGYGSPEVAEPGDTKNIFATFPTLGNGIEEVGLIVCVEPPHERSEPAHEQNYLVTASGIRRIKTYSSCEASVKSKQFFVPDDETYGVETYNVGYLQLEIDGEAKEDVTVDMTAGLAHVNISYVVGLPNDEVRKILKLDLPNERSQYWLPVPLPMRPQSAWASHLMKLDGWAHDRKSGVPNMVHREIAMKSGETQTVTIESAVESAGAQNELPAILTYLSNKQVQISGAVDPAKLNLQGVDQFIADGKKVNNAKDAGDAMPVKDANALEEEQTSSATTTGFATPDALMQFTKNCLEHGDVSRWFDCWTDEAATELAALWLINTTTALQAIETNPKDFPPGVAEEVKIIKSILNEGIDSSEAKVKLTELVQATIGVVENAGSSFEEISNAISNNPLVHMRAMATAKSLKDLRRFVVRFTEFDKGMAHQLKSYDFENAIEQSGDTATAIFKTDGNKIRFSKTVNGWLISDLNETLPFVKSAFKCRFPVSRILKPSPASAADSPKRTNAKSKDNELNTSSKSSPEYPPVKIVVHDEEGKPLEGVKVSLYQIAKDQGGQVLEINETSDGKGMAVNRNLPYGHYALSVKTADGWYLPGSGSKINVEFEKGLDFILVAPTPVPFSKLIIRDDVKTTSASVSELRFGILEEVNGSGFWVSAAPEPEADLGDYETFPTIANGIEHVGVDIRYEIAKCISQPSPSALHLNTKWKWYPDQAKSSRRYLIVNGHARGFVNGTVDQGIRLHVWPKDDSQLFRLPSSKHRVGASLIALREPTALPLELAIPAGEISIYVERILGRPNAAAMEALNTQAMGNQEELWLEAKVQRNSAWIERLVDTTGWMPTILKPGYNEISGHLQMHKLMKSGENLEIFLGGQKMHKKESNASEARTLDDLTSVYNDQTRQLRTELFTPPIPDLTTDQMRAAMLDAAEQYRKDGKVEIASALKTSAETNRLADRLTFMGMSGTMSQGFRQITPTFHFEVAGNSLHSVILPKAELRYSLHGWSSKTWGDIHPPITGKWELVSVEEHGETLTQAAYAEWRKSHESWTELTIDATSLTMAGDNAAKLDFSVDYDAGLLPQYTIRQDGNTKYSGVLMGSGFIDDNQLVFAIDLEGSSTPQTFHTTDGKSTNLTYRRHPMPDIPTIFQSHPRATDRVKRAFESAATVARKDDTTFNTLHLLAALMRDGSLPEIAEVAERKKISMTDLINRCDDAARVAERLFKATGDRGTGVSQTTSAEQWKELFEATELKAKEWKHDYLGPAHLLMALIADDPLTKLFLKEQGIDAAEIRDMTMQIYFSPGRDAPVVPKQ